MQLTVIGNGTMMPTKQTNPSSFLLEYKKTKILLDCGHGTVRRLVDIGIGLNNIDAVLVSHFHTDHFADVIPLIHSRVVADMRSGSQHKSITIIGPKSIKKHIATLRSIFWPEPNESYPYYFKEGERVKTKIKNIAITTFPVQHVPWFKSVGFCLKTDNKKIVYTGDVSGLSNLDAFTKQARGADLLIVDASQLHGIMKSHLTLDQIEPLAQQSDVKKILLAHTPPKERIKIKKWIAHKPRFSLAELGEVVRI